ncbi:MAG: glycoside hydrolase family 28 protein [Phycisphaerae bacterium]|nr:glycoside hydrolase family 28 protein [Phycisphaerae bacterium]
MIEVNINDFGATGNAVTDNSDAFRKAIEECSKDKGGRVIVPPGKYLTGPIRLKSDTTLHLEEDAVISFSDNFDDYPAVKSRWEGVECFGYCPCLYGQDLKNVSITGKGVIDGNGYRWWNEYKKRIQHGQTTPISERDKKFEKLNKDIDISDCGGGGIGSFFFRPPLIQFNNCSNVLLDGITARNSPFWNTHLLYCKDVTVENATFQNPDEGKNGDGLDIDSCNSVEVNGCIFDVNDDGLCLKSGIGKNGMQVNRPCENISIKNCKVLRGHGGVVIGSETAAGIRNVKISDCQFQGTDRGIRIKSRRGRSGTVENIEFTNIDMNDVGCPIVINLYYNCGAPVKEIKYLSDRTPKPITDTTPCIRNIKLTNITAANVQTAAAFLLGLPERPIENIVFDNVKITLAKEGIPGYPAMAFDVKKMQGAGIIDEFVKGFVQRNVHIK